MMEPINPEELSAYVDGELDAHRARQVATAIESDPATRQAYQIIAQADSAWRAAAQSARFRPKTALPSRIALESAASMCAAILLLLAVRALPKLSDAMTWGLMLQGIALGAIVLWVVAFASKSPDLDEPKPT
jgi:anti-sigma factor RsiW